MAINPGALNAYNAASGLTGPKSTPAATSAKASGADFGAMVENAARGFVDSQKTGEQAALEAVKGNADLTDVVTAVNAAEISLQTVVAVRDKVVEAYQEVMRMPI